MARAPIEAWNLTGAARFRRTLLGFLVLEVEQHISLRDPAVKGRKTFWRRARKSDLGELRKARTRHELEPLL